VRDIEEHIRKAMQEGKFDNLPGKGEPLRMVSNPHEDPEWSLAYKALRDAGFSLPWIETRREIDTGLDAARNDLRRAWEWKKSPQAASLASTVVQAEWQRAVDRFHERVAEINKSIKDYNLEAPSPNFHIYPVNVEKELKKLE
jgi:DnaJ family protein C protein 28